MNLRTLENDFLRFRIAPDLGASPVELSLHRRHLPSAPPDAPDWLPILRPTSTQTLLAGESAAFSSYTLAPYSNRIRDGLLRFRGQTHRIAPNWPDGQTIHGDVRMRPFDIDQKSATWLVARYESRRAQQPNFPFHYQFETEYRLQDSRLVIDLRLTCCDERDMPAGLGIHPYFVRRLWPGTPDPQLRFVAQGFYAVDDQVIPSEAAKPLLPQHDFRTLRDVYAQRVDCVFSGWDGQALLTWPETGLSLHLQADPVYSHFVVYNGDPDGTLALEPVSHATDACNLAERGIPGTGLQILAPQQTLHGRIVLRLDPHPATA